MVSARGPAKLTRMWNLLSLWGEDPVASERQSGVCSAAGRACGERSGRLVGVRRAGGPANPAAWGPHLGGMGLNSLDSPSQDPAGGGRRGRRRGGLRATGLGVSELCLPLPDTGACSFSSLVEFQTALETGPAAYLE